MNPLGVEVAVRGHMTLVETVSGVRDTIIVSLIIARRQDMPKNWQRHIFCWNRFELRTGYIAVVGIFFLLCAVVSHFCVFFSKLNV